MWFFRTGGAMQTSISNASQHAQSKHDQENSWNCCLRSSVGDNPGCTIAWFCVATLHHVVVNLDAATRPCLHKGLTCCTLWFFTGQGRAATPAFASINITVLTPVGFRGCGRCGRCICHGVPLSCACGGGLLGCGGLGCCRTTIAGEDNVIVEVARSKHVVTLDPHIHWTRLRTYPFAAAGFVAMDVLCRGSSVVVAIVRRIGVFGVNRQAGIVIITWNHDIDSIHITSGVICPVLQRAQSFLRSSHGVGPVTLADSGAQAQQDQEVHRLEWHEG